MSGNIYKLYAVSPCGASVADLLAAEAGGATCLQLREKHLSDADFLEKALELKGKLHIPLFINDNVDVALKCGAEGVHIGQSDMELAAARKILGPDVLIGVSATNLDEALRAEAGGADYLGVGAVFPTGTKTDACMVSLDELKRICSTVKIPVVAIGGIHSDNLHLLRSSGIVGTAVISELFNGGDIRRNTAEYLHLTEENLGL